LSFSIALLSSPINRFIRYTTINRENKTINTAIDGLAAYDQLENALESPNNELKIKLTLVKH
jgi:hypothetical protein